MELRQDPAVGAPRAPGTGTILTPQVRVDETLPRKLLVGVQVSPTLEGVDRCGRIAFHHSSGGEPIEKLRRDSAPVGSLPLDPRLVVGGVRKKHPGKKRSSVL